MVGRVEVLSEDLEMKVEFRAVATSSNILIAEQCARRTSRTSAWKRSRSVRLDRDGWLGLRSLPVVCMSPPLVAAASSSLV